MARKVKNIYKINGSVVEVEIYDKQDCLKGVAYISIKHLDIVKSYQWSIFKSRKRMYAHAHIGNSKYIKMHRLVAELEFGKNNMTVDHLDRNGLNNIPENLRYATDSQQCHNKGDYKSNTSGVKGVRFVKQTGRWRAEMGFLGQRLIKDFLTKEDAIKQRKMWENEYKKTE